MERRRFLKAIGATALAGVPLLQACSQGAAPAAKPAESKPADAKPGQVGQPAEAKPAQVQPAEAPKPAAAPAKGGGVREISFMSIGNERDQNMFKEAIDTAQAATLDAMNIKINFQPGPASGPGAWEKVMTMFAADQAFDIQRIDDDRVYLLAVENKIHQLDQMILDHGMKKDDYFPAFWTTLAVEGYQYSLNPAGGANVVYYNTDLFQQAGITAPTSWKDAWGWDEFLANARKLGKVTGGRTDVYALAFPPNISTPTGYGNGATAFNDDQTKCAFNGREVHDVIDPFVQMAVQEKIVAPPELQDAGRLELFNAGKLAMTWESMGFDRQVSKSIKWDVMPWMKTTKRAMTENYDRTFVISRTAKDPEAAFLGLKALCERAASDVFAKHRFGVPYLRASAEGPILNDPSAAPVHKNLWLETFDVIDGNPVDVPTPRSPVGEAWKQAYTDELFEGALAGQMTTQQFLDQATARVDEQIGKWQWNKTKGMELLQKGGGLTHPDRKVLA